MQQILQNNHNSKPSVWQLGYIAIGFLLYHIPSIGHLWMFAFLTAASFCLKKLETREQYNYISMYVVGALVCFVVHKYIICATDFTLCLTVLFLFPQKLWYMAAQLSGYGPFKGIGAEKVYILFVHPSYVFINHCRAT